MAAMNSAVAANELTVQAQRTLALFEAMLPRDLATLA
jgi:hypothetical protein